jgi:nucleotide-binding universal stress UspA family protein
MSQRSLVPLDGSPTAELALAEALALAQLPDSAIILLEVIPVIRDVITSEGAMITIDQQWDIRCARARAYLGAVLKRPEWQNVRAEFAVETGDPAEVILDFAVRYEIDRIIISTHGGHVRTGIYRWVHGTVARQVLEAADRTVVLVRAKAPEA